MTGVQIGPTCTNLWNMLHLLNFKEKSHLFNVCAYIIIIVFRRKRRLNIFSNIISVNTVITNSQKSISASTMYMKELMIVTQTSDSDMPLQW